MACRYILSGLLGCLIFMLSAHPLLSFVSAQDNRTGYINRAGVDLLSGSSGNSVRLQMTHGYRFTNRLSAGIGSGYVFYRDPVDLIPVFIDVVYQLREGGVTPFFQLKTGYSISILRDRDLDPDRHSGGPILNPGLGLHIRNADGPGIYLSAGFNLDNSKFELESFGDRIINESISYRRISLSFGFIF